MNSISRRTTSLISGISFAILMLAGQSAWSQSTFAPLTDICENAPQIILTGGGPTAGTYFGTGVVGGTTFNPATTPGPFPATYQIGFKCNTCTDSAYQNITVLAKPVVSLSALGPYCSNADSLVLTGGSPSVPAGFYFGPGVSTSSGRFGPSIGAGPHDVNYVYQNVQGCSDTATTSVVVNVVTDAEFTGLDTAYCLEEPSPVALSAVFPVGTGTFGPTTLMTGNNFNVPTTPGNYEVYYFYTDANNCSDTSFKDVRIRPKPAVTFIIDPNEASVCDSDPAFPITLSGASPANGSFTGTGVIGGNIFDPGTAGVGTFKLYYTATGPLGCENIDSSQSVVVNTSPTVSFTLPFDSVCSNDPNFFLPLGVVNGVPSAGTYSGPGVNGSAPFEFTPVLAGGGTHTIQFEGTANGCTNIATRTIKVNPKPVVTFTNTIKKCANDSAFILNVALPLGGTYSGVGVNPDGITFDPSTTTGPGNYQLFYTFTDAAGCSDTNSQPIELDTFPNLTITSVPAPAKICFGDTAELTATSTPPNPIFVWETNNGDLSANGGDNILAYPAQTKTITLIGRLANNCSNSTTIELEVIQNAVAQVNGDFDICFGDTTTLNATGATTYEWSEGDLPGLTLGDNISVSPIWDTTYSVIALSDVDGNGKQCSQDTTEVVVVVNSLPIISAGIDTMAFIGDQLPLQGYGGETYVWSGALDPDDFSCTDCPDPIVTVLPEDSALSIMYYVVGTDSNGCVNNDSILVTIDESVVVFVPTAFSPNNDGANDSLFVRGKGIKSIEFQVFNRRGEEVFTTKKMDEGWDGTFNGQPLNKEVFVYYLNVTPFIKEAFKQTGSITLVR